MRRVTAICYVLESNYAEIIALGFILLRHVRKVFEHLPSIAFLRFCGELSSTLFIIPLFCVFWATWHSHHLQTSKSRQNVFLPSKRLSHKLLCVYGVWWGWQAIIESTKMHFLSDAIEKPGERHARLNLFSIFNIKNMCLETTSFPCISVPIVSSSWVRTLILIIFRNINRVSLGSKFFIREKRFSSHPVRTQRDQRCENPANAVFVFQPRRGKNFNFPIFTRRRSCSRFNERLARRCARRKSIIENLWSLIDH